jgi:hypothetical protein
MSWSEKYYLLCKVERGIKTVKTFRFGRMLISHPNWFSGEFVSENVAACFCALQNAHDEERKLFFFLPSLRVQHTSQNRGL